MYSFKSFIKAGPTLYDADGNRYENVNVYDIEVPKSDVTDALCEVLCDIYFKNIGNRERLIRCIHDLVVDNHLEEILFDDHREDVESVIKTRMREDDLY